MFLLLQQVQTDKEGAMNDARAWAWGEMKQTVDTLQSQLVELSRQDRNQQWLDPNFKVCNRVAFKYVNAYIPYVSAVQFNVSGAASDFGEINGGIVYS